MHCQVARLMHPGLPKKRLAVPEIKWNACSAEAVLAAFGLVLAIELSGRHCCYLGSLVTLNGAVVMVLLIVEG